MLRPTNINDYFNPNQHKKTSNSVWWFLGGSLLSVGVAVTIPMKPDFNIQSISRVIFSGITLGCGIGVIATAKKIDDNFYYAAKYQEAQATVFDNAIVQHTLIQTVVDDNYYSQFLPPEEQQPQYQQMQPQPEYEEQEEYYQPQQQAYQPNANYQEYEEPQQEVNSEYAWSNDLLGYPNILVWGPQGSGKTSFAEWLVAERLKRGHEVIICDPHREYGQWEGLRIVGDGMDYEAIDKELVSFTSKIVERYKNRSKIKGYNPQPITIVCDEFTNWSERCEGAPEFSAQCQTDIRKINLHALFISHDNTNGATGGKRGMAKARKAGQLEIELEAKVHPVTGEASPKLKGKLRYPGMADRDRLPVKIAPWMKVSSDFRGLVKQPKQPTKPSEEPDQATVIDVEAKEVVRTDQSQSLAVSESSIILRYNSIPTSINTLDDAIALVSHKLQNPDSPPLAEGKNREQIQLIFKALLYHKQGKVNSIKALWGITKSGTSAKYKQAEELYSVLLAECSGNEVTEFLSQLTTITFPETRLLPASAGVYFVFSSDYELYYIGSSNNILFRWNSPKYGKHHRYDQVEAVAQNKTVKIGWILTSDYERIEADLVAKFKPVWNGNGCHS